MDLIHTALLILISGALNQSTSQRVKRKNSDNFNVLLSLFKVNPLKDSDVFRTFSNTILLPAKGHAMNFDSNESDLNGDQEIKVIKPILQIKAADISKQTHISTEDNISQAENFFDPLPLVQKLGLKDVVLHENIIFEEAFVKSTMKHTHATVVTMKPETKSFVEDIIFGGSENSMVTTKNVVDKKIVDIKNNEINNVISQEVVVL